MFDPIVRGTYRVVNKVARIRCDMRAPQAGLINVVLELAIVKEACHLPKAVTKARTIDAGQHGPVSTPSHLASGSKAS